MKSKAFVALLVAALTSALVVSAVAHGEHYFSGCCGAGPDDRKPGDIRGQAYFQVRYVLSPAGKPIRR